MRKIVDYLIIRTADADHLCAQVVAGIADGWQPLGGIAVDHQWIIQAMVKYEAEPRTYGISVGTAEGAELVRRTMDRDYTIYTPAPINPTPSDAPGWPAPGVYGDPAGGERE
jgi:hypothetical protein